ncbi:MAG TPA: histidine kinase dimerization/phospho-acceptor domain-containing protein [Gaiellaceae bacterium]|nr:histidine kinase dimerization/phospho-acceptor domain-containing protein [Gaiellaceae bacterium]
MPEDPQFARLVMLACHDLRTPLATVHGFAHTLARTEDLDGTTARYVEMINAAATQLAELIDDLSVSARLAGDRYDPPLQTVDTMELAHSAAERLGDERVLVSGEGAEVELDAEAAERAVGSLARCALRHGGLEEVELAVRGQELALSPVTPASAPVLLGEDLRDLGAAVAVRVVRARGGSVAVEGETLTIRFT